MIFYVIKSNDVLIQKCFNVLFLGAFSLSVFGCENTDYSAEWKDSNFNEISIGDNVHRVYDLIGEPFVVYAYPIPRKYAKPIKVELADFPSSIGDYDGLELDLHFSRQINAHRDYKLYVVNLKQGRVSGKIATVVGD